MIKPTLLILAAGMGSRYGSLKQIDAIGPSGETIIDYSVFDAIRAGFGKVVFVIREDIEKEFKEVFEKRFGNAIQVDYVFQELNFLPEGFKVPEERQKPWGTCHAVLMAANKINEPFAVINADDFYGAEAFKTIAEFLTNPQASDSEYAMVGYYLNKTLSEYGYVSRGVCQSNEDSYLIDVVEREKIGIANGKIAYQKDGEYFELSGNEIVSMNFWGFQPSYFNYLNNQFVNFLKENINKPKSEFYIPYSVNLLIKNGSIKLRVLESDSKWFGVTYKEDKLNVINNISELVKQGIYPANLWEK
ncbi:MAG: nucleotidyltransferase [Chlorobi bacterium]|nr:nucleotidyltransferase [Chlorobiota bacterium]